MIMIMIMMMMIRLREEKEEERSLKSAFSFFIVETARTPRE